MDFSPRNAPKIKREPLFPPLFNKDCEYVGVPDCRICQKSTRGSYGKVLCVDCADNELAMEQRRIHVRIKRERYAYLRRITEGVKPGYINRWFHMARHEITGAEAIYARVEYFKTLWSLHAPAEIRAGFFDSTIQLFAQQAIALMQTHFRSYFLEVVRRKDRAFHARIMVFMRAREEEIARAEGGYHEPRAEAEAKPELKDRLNAIKGLCDSTNKVGASADESAAGVATANKMLRDVLCRFSPTGRLKVGEPEQQFFSDGPVKKLSPDAMQCMAYAGMDAADYSAVELQLAAQEPGFLNRVMTLKPGELYGFLAPGGTPGKTMIHASPGFGKAGFTDRAEQ